MKKSVIAVLVSSTIVLAGCEPEPTVDVNVFGNIQECELVKTPEECEWHFQNAEAQHLLTAPRFESASECEAEFGTCETKQVTNPDGSVSNVLLPAMMGFMMGNMMSSTNPMYMTRTEQDRERRGGGGVYHSAAGNAYKKGASTVTMRSVQPVSKPIMVKAGTGGLGKAMSSGGFGRAGAAVGGRSAG